jgi:hypothetical protein
MSVNFCARALSEKLEARLRAEPHLATSLAAEHDAIDFRRDATVARYENETRTRPLSDAMMARVDRAEAANTETWKTLTADGIERRDVDESLELHRAYLGLSWGWSATTTARLFFEDDGGLHVGDDVGYGPARLFSNSEISAALAEIEKVDIATFAARYREGFVVATKDAISSALAEYDDFALVMSAFHRFVGYLREARIAGRALLVWFE